MKIAKKISQTLRTTLFSKRCWLGGSYLEYIIILLIFAALAIAYTNFVALNITTQIFVSYPADGSGGFMWYNFAQPGLDPILRHSDMVNYPHGEDIGGPTFITYMALWIPVRALGFIFGPVAGINIFMLFGYVLTSLSMYWLIKKLVGSIQIAAFAGFAVAFTPYAIEKSLDHLPYILSYVFVFIIAGFIAIWRRPTVLRSLLLSAAIAIAFYTDGYYILLSSVLIGGLVVAALLHSQLIRMRWADLWKRIKALGLTVVCLLILLSPIAWLQLSQGGQIKDSLDGRRSDIAAELQQYKTKVMDLIIPSYSNPFLNDSKDFNTVQQYKNQRSNVSESTNYIGFVLIMLSAIGGTILVIWFTLRRYSSLKLMEREDRDTAVLIGCIFIFSVPLMLSFMFSPSVHMFGYTIPMPGQLFIDYDITLWRVMSRFFVPLHVVFVLFAAISLWVILILSKVNSLANRKKSMVIWLVVGILTVLLAAEYATTSHRPSYDFDKVANGYSWLGRQSSIKSVVELPVVDPLDRRTADYVTNQIVHGKKLVNSKETTNTSLTNVLGGIDNPETIDWAYQRGAQAAITHGELCTSVSWGKLLFRDDKNIEQAMCVYSINKPVTNDEIFIKFEDGFLHRPNTSNQDVVVFEDARASLIVTADNFMPTNNGGRAIISTTLGQNAGPATWQVSQNGRKVGGGYIENQKIQIEVVVDMKHSVDIKIERLDKRVVQPGEYNLSYTTARSL